MDFLHQIVKLEIKFANKVNDYSQKNRMCNNFGAKINPETKAIFN